MPVPDGFSSLVASMDSAMVVVTVAADGERGGCLVGFHCQASIEPPAYAVWLSTANRTWRLAQRASHLAVHLLRDDQHELAVLFGGETGDEVDKLGQVGWTPGAGGVPLLDACPARLVGRIAERLDVGGDHVCIVVEDTEVTVPPPMRPFRLHQASDIDPGHPA
jgi:flavin reductase (DIM6/NTAB) family NADH-FMN oxidoreductase RutF